MAGRYQGRQGLAGPRSILFYALPVPARATAELRPDLRVHVLCENAGTTRPEFRRAMLLALGLSAERANDYTAR
eukprot:915426-Lingulodinium_polyedra.AAC.1